MTNDIEALNQLVTTGVVTLISSVMTLVGVVVILLLLDLKLALVTFLTFPLLLVASLIFRIASHGAYRITRERIAAVTAYLQETLSGVRVVRSFGQEPRHAAEMDALNEANRDANMRTVYLNATYFPAVELLSAVATARSSSTAARRRSTTRSRSASSSPSSVTCRSSSNRSSSSPSSTPPTSRGWPPSTRSSSCSTPSPTWSTPPTRSTPARCAARSRWTTSGSATSKTGRPDAGARERDLR